jgi:hypothetical protein
MKNRNYAWGPIVICIWVLVFWSMVGTCWLIHSQKGKVSQNGNRVTTQRK